MRFGAERVALWIGLVCCLAFAQSPTANPTQRPTFRPTEVPTSSPTADGTPWPTPRPTSNMDAPTGQPTGQPTCQPTSQPSGQPTFSPTIEGVPTYAPTPRPTAVAPPTFAPTPVVPVVTPAPTDPASSEPTNHPSGVPTGQPTLQPTTNPTGVRPDPTPYPTAAPTAKATPSPTYSREPTSVPSGQPTLSPTAGPTDAPQITPPPVPLAVPTNIPTSEPSSSPSVSPNPTKIPSGQPSSQPSSQPSGQPTFQPSGQPTSQPSVPTGRPSSQPSSSPTAKPSVRTTPTDAPTPHPSANPTANTRPTAAPSTGAPNAPSSEPTGFPSSSPSAGPTDSPLKSVSQWPSGQPTSQPSGQPTCAPSTWAGRDTRYTYAPTPLFSQDNITGTVVFDPADVSVCEDVEVKIIFNSKMRMNQYGAYRINTPGLTIGDCHTVTELAGHADGQGIKLMASWPFDVRFFEGRASDTFLGSFVIATYNDPDELHWRDVDQNLNIDRSNGLKRTCPGSAPNATWSVFRYIQSPLYNETEQPYPTAAPTAATTGWLPTPNPTAWMAGITNQIDTLYPTSMPTAAININAADGSYESGYVGFLAEKSDYLEAMCFVYNSKLEFWPAWHHSDMTVNLTLTLGQVIHPGDTIDLHLPGFTNQFGHFPLNPGLVYNESDEHEWNFAGSSFEEERYGQYTGLLNITSFSTNTDTPQVSLFDEDGPWAGYWFEGENATDYATSFLRLYANRTHPAATQFSIVIDRCPNALVAVLGREPNFQGFNFVITGGVYYTNNTVPDTTDAIGDGCRALNYCNGNGHCNHRTSTCTCFEGYGATFDRLQAVSDDFLPDCSARTCPTGPAFGALARDLSTGLHREMECSNVGSCDRELGICKCPQGFEGANCGRRVCPRGHNGDICSGRGVCKSMHRLASDGRALPLSSDSSITYTTLWQNGTKASWDADMGHACVCDSAWTVGLGSYETQLAEFFGPACQLKRCPSGDDPTTMVVNETDCYQLSQTGGSETGAAGNLCHIDCSNKGKCDHSTGICTCYDGWYGNNCMHRRSQVGVSTRERLISEL